MTTLRALVPGLIALCVTAAAALPLAAQVAQAAEDPYRYLEDASDARTQEFLREHAAKARAVLDAVPGRAEMLGRVRALSETTTSVSQIRLAATRVFYLKRGPGQASDAICVRDGASAAERVLVQPEAGRAIDWYSPSPDGRHVAFGVSSNGSEDSVLRVYSLEASRALPFEIDRARFNADLAWHPDGRSFYYARIAEANPPGKAHANVRLYRHVLGRATDRDEIVFAPGVGGARDVGETVRPSLHLPADSKYAYAVAREGLRRSIAVHVALQKDLAAAKPRWHRLAGVEDEVLAIEGSRDDLFVLTRRHSPRHHILRVKGGAQSLAGAPVAVAQGDAVIQDFGIARDAVYLKTTVGGLDRLERVALGLLGSKSREFVKTPFDVAISELVTHPRIAGTLLLIQGWIEPPSVIHVEAGSGNLRKTPIVPASSADFGEIDEVRLYAPAADGVKIPITLFYRKSTTLNRDNPTILMAYGSFGMSLSAVFDPARLAWLERGGIMAVAHVRGGGEYGAEWHRGGQRGTKANTIGDLVAVAEFLVSYGFTSPRKLAIEGRVAGGVPVGGALVRRPELFGAVVAHGPFMDLVRYDLSPEGPAHASEFGAAGEALREISPYHQVRDGVGYPAILFMVGGNDTRAGAWQAAKMLARLEAASQGARPALLRVDSEGGSGKASRAQHAAELADEYAFLLWQMSDAAVAPPPPPPPPSPRTTQ